jgi:hypothetical protein
MIVKDESTARAVLYPEYGGEFARMIVHGPHGGHPVD